MSFVHKDVYTGSSQYLLISWGGGSQTEGSGITNKKGGHKHGGRGSQTGWSVSQTGGHKQGSHTVGHKQGVTNSGSQSGGSQTGRPSRVSLIVGIIKRRAIQRGHEKGIINRGDKARGIPGSDCPTTTHPIKKTGSFQNSSAKIEASAHSLDRSM